MYRIVIGWLYAVILILNVRCYSSHVLDFHSCIFTKLLHVANQDYWNPVFGEVLTRCVFQNASIVKTFSPIVNSALVLSFPE